MSSRHSTTQEPRTTMMDVSEILSGPNPPIFAGNGYSNHALPRPMHAYSTRHASSSYDMYSHMPPPTEIIRSAPNLNYPAYAAGQEDSPAKRHPRLAKTVNFQLILSETPHHKARLPLRVHINAHDSTESIITTVKNFYGLYEGQGVSFEDSEGVTLIAQYENLDHEATVHVRLTSEHPDMYDAHARRSNGSGSPQKPRLEEPFQMLPPQPYSRPQSRSAKKRSASPPSGRGRRGGSSFAQPKPRFRNGFSYDTNEDNDAGVNGMSDSDAGSVSVSSSRRAKSDQVASADISLDNIVEGGRRKRAKFESSELPLFAPPQQPMTASISSMSPQRRLMNPNFQSPMAYNNQHNFAWNHSLPSPQSHTYGENGHIHNGNGIGHHGENGQRLRARTYSGPAPVRLPAISVPRVLPTPDPTIGSVISDEDVALQLMRLGDASNLSLGRTSTSTMDDALSGKAEAASSDGDTDEESLGEQELPPLIAAKPTHIAGPTRKRQKVTDTALPTFESADTSGEEYDDGNDASFKGESDGLTTSLMPNMERQSSKVKTNKVQANGVIGHTKARPSISKVKSKTPSAGRIPPSPYSQPSLGRKGSQVSLITQLQLDIDDDDLSSKPRCQRCRKSKKGCDRQRPCQRCKDAGIGIEGCVSEDEGNGRKGRYGRHMGVPVKHDSLDSVDTTEHSPVEFHEYSPEAQTVDGSKKRKR